MAQIGQVEDMQTAASSLFAPLRITAPADRPFHAEVADASVGPAVIAKMAYTPGLVRRLPRLITSGDPELMLVTMQRQGKSIVSQDGRECQAGPGGLVAYDTRRPYDLACPDRSDIIAFAMPREMLGPGGDLISRRTAVTVPGDRGIRSVITAFFTGLADTALADDGPAGDGAVAGNDRELPGLAPDRLADAAASLLVSAFTGIPGERVELPTGLADQILAYALANLHDPGLSVTSAARRFGISPRYLHALMRERDIQFSAWVRRERLKRIRRDLLDPRLASYTAAAIAARWGIDDPAHLSRALRAEFGCSAAEIRAAGAGTGH